jgi:hypothetical protein
MVKDKWGKTWQSANYNLFGGHGFGMKKQGTSSDHWIEAFY